MTKEQQQIAIAEHCEWKWEPETNTFLHKENGRVKADLFLLNFENDVRARKQAWLTLKEHQKHEFRIELYWLCENNGQDGWVEESEFDHWPEAFLRAIGKWKEAE